MGQNFTRALQLPDLTKQSVFLWGPRKVGKSSWIKQNLKNCICIDLLLSDVFSEYASRPALLRERFSRECAQGNPIVIDEVQRCPSLLDEVHWLIENSSLTFLLTGSSARKLRKQHANLLGGRAWRRTMRPLCAPEIGEVDLEKAILQGLLPRHYLSPSPQEELRSYVADYLKEEIAQEALVRNLPSFSDFLRVAAISTGELLNYSNVAREVGVSPKVVRGYFEILEDTLLGFRIPPWSRSRNRRMVETEKFYLFDVGISNFLARRTPRSGSAEFGKSFEHFMLMELLAFQAYRNPELEIRFWRTSNRQEVDFILNDREVAIEIKTSSRVHGDDVKSLGLLSEDGPVGKRMVVSQESLPRTVQDRFGRIEILPWREFLSQLWANAIVDQRF